MGRGAWLISMELGFKAERKEEVSPGEQITGERGAVQELSGTPLFGCWSAGAGPARSLKRSQG